MGLPDDMACTASHVKISKGLCSIHTREGYMDSVENAPDGLDDPLVH